jgi:hypothetical protein
MATLLDNLDELDRLVGAARKGRQSENFISSLHDVMSKVSALLIEKQKPNDFMNKFLDAASNLKEKFAAYEERPTLLGVSNVGNALVRYRTTATS